MTATYLGMYEKNSTPSCAALGVFCIVEADGEWCGWYVRAFNSDIGPFKTRDEADEAYWHVINHGTGLELPKRIPMFTKVGLGVIGAIVLLGVFWNDMAGFATRLFQ